MPTQFECSIAAWGAPTRLGRTRPGAFLYSVSRGAVIDEAALVEALRAGKLGGAGLDVFEEEPGVLRVGGG